jgi:hypothetical protein
VIIEQLVYGSFPFWDRGYDVLARSPGCRPESVADVLSACRKFGEAPAGVSPSPSLFAMRLASGPWAIVGVEPQGVDDRGRPGALAFHALLIEPGDFRKAGSNPFAFTGALRRDWSSGTTLDAVSWTVETPAPAPPTDPRTRKIAQALVMGRTVELKSSNPIDSLAREVWACLPGSIRRRRSVATWAFGNANGFDLVALPRPSGVELERSESKPAIEPEPTQPVKVPRRLPLYRGAAIVAGLGGIIAAGLAWRALDHSRSSGLPTDPRSAIPGEPDSPISPEARARIVAELETLADRFEVGGSNDPGELMARISTQVRYRGPTLSTAELARLASESDPDRIPALAWHDRLITTFADDRPLPEDFDRLTLARQLDRLAWSFRLEPMPRPEAIPGALLDSLSRQGPIRPTPLASRYPALTDYARFLGKLPRLEK